MDHRSFNARGIRLAPSRHATPRRLPGGRSLRNSMGEMAKSLERDRQLESILAIKKSAQLGIEGLAREHNLTRQLAMSIGFDLRRGRGLGL